MLVASYHRNDGYESIHQRMVSDKEAVFSFVIENLYNDALIYFDEDHDRAVDFITGEVDKHWE